MSEIYTVKQAGFEGPLGILLNLIDKRKLSINDVSLSSVTEDYIKFIQSRDISKREISSFFVTATTLMLIKSISLLPGIIISEEEERSIEELERRLRIYKAFKNITSKLEEIFDSKIHIYYASDLPEKISVFSPHKTITKENLSNALTEILSQIPTKDNLVETRVEKIISLEEMIKNLYERVQSHISMSFNEFTGKSKVINKETKLNVIISFLAILELVKQETLIANQESTYYDITIESI